MGTKSTALKKRDSREESTPDKALRQPPRRSKLPDQRVQHQLLQAAKKLFAGRGLTGTSIRDISNEAGVNSSMISYYFGGKEALYRECLREVAENTLALTQKILRVPPASPEEFRLRLVLFSEALFDIFISDREAGLIVVREYDRVHSPAENVFKGSFMSVIDEIVKFFRTAQNSHLIDEGKDPFILGTLFFGALTSQLRLDHLKEELYNRSLKEVSERKQTLSHLVDLFAT